MAESSLIINATDQAGNKLQRTMTFASDVADRDKMLTFAQGINGLLTNNFVEAKRVQKVDLDDDPDGGYKQGAGYEVIGYPEDASEPDESKTTPTITLSQSTITLTDYTAALADNYFYDVDITYDGDGSLYVANPQVGGGRMRSNQTPFGNIIDDNGTKKLRFAVDEAYKSAPYSNVNGAVSVCSGTTDNCNPASATFTITN